MHAGLRLLCQLHRESRAYMSIPAGHTISKPDNETQVIISPAVFLVQKQLTSPRQWRYITHDVERVFHQRRWRVSYACAFICVRVYPSHVVWCSFMGMGSVGPQVGKVARKSCEMCNDARRTNWPARGQACCVVWRRNRGVCMFLLADLLFVSSSACRPHPGRAGEPFRFGEAWPFL